MAEAVTLDKRKRDSAQRSASEDDAPPRKKSRIQEPAAQPAQRPVAGPSKRRDTAPEHIPQKADVEAGGAQRRDADIGAGSKSRRNASDGDADAAEEDSGSDGDDEDVEEDLGPPGPEDYHGEIFGSPTGTEDNARVPKRRTTPTSDSSEEREELYGLLEDSVQQEHDGEDGMDDDGLADRTLIGQAGCVVLGVATWGRAFVHRVLTMMACITEQRIMVDARSLEQVKTFPYCRRLLHQVHPRPLEGTTSA